MIINKTMMDLYKDVALLVDAQFEKACGTYPLNIFLLHYMSITTDQGKYCDWVKAVYDIACNSFKQMARFKADDLVGTAYVY